jgi:hypothetical protein
MNDPKLSDVRTDFLFLQPPIAGFQTDRHRTVFFETFVTWSEWVFAKLLNISYNQN